MCYPKSIAEIVDYVGKTRWTLCIRSPSFLLWRGVGGFRVRPPVTADSNRRSAKSHRIVTCHLRDLKIGNVVFRGTTCSHPKHELNQDSAAATAAKLPPPYLPSIVRYSNERCLRWMLSGRRRQSLGKAHGSAALHLRLLTSGVEP